jgi:hypothetical protein
MGDGEVVLAAVRTKTEVEAYVLLLLKVIGLLTDVEINIGRGSEDGMKV